MKNVKAIECDCYMLKDEDGNQGILPVFKTVGAACADIAIPKKVTILQHYTLNVDLLIAFDIPKGYKIVMYPRSSLLVKHNLMSPVSIIDWDYKGKVHVPLHNLADTKIILEAGTRVAQIECVPCGPRPDNWLKEDAMRDQNGFGGTGVI